MVVNKQLREYILKKHSDKTPRRVNQIISKFAKDKKIVDRDIAVYAYASDVLGINIKQKKYSTDAQILSQVQNALQSAPQVVVQKEKSPDKKKSEKPVVLNFSNFKIEDPILPRKLAEEADFMAKKVYPVIYVFENSVRNIIIKLLEKKHGPDWWNKDTISSKTKQKVEGRISDEDRNRWHGKRGVHPIFYSDIDDLKNIITSNWNDFKPYLKTSQAIIIANIEIIEQSRNVISHNNPLSNDDIDSVKVHFKQWIKLIKNVKF